MKQDTSAKASLERTSPSLPLTSSHPTKECWPVGTQQLRGFPTLVLVRHRRHVAQRLSDLKMRLSRSLRADSLWSEGDRKASAYSDLGNTAYLSTPIFAPRPTLLSRQVVTYRLLPLRMVEWRCLLSEAGECQARTISQPELEPKLMALRQRISDVTLGPRLLIPLMQSLTAFAFLLHPNDPMSSNGEGQRTERQQRLLDSMRPQSTVSVHGLPNELEVPNR